MMLLSVIIPTFKRRETLSICLKHLAPEIQNLSPDLFEVIVTDDAPDNTPDDSLSRDYPWVFQDVYKRQYLISSLPPKTGGEIYAYKLYEFLERRGRVQEYLSLIHI